jgi:hypothetical protein
VVSVSGADDGTTDPVDDTEPAIALSKPATEAVSWLREFAAAHAGTVAVPHYLGWGRTRIVTIAGDGTFGDAVVESVEAAEEVCRQAAVPVAEWDRETSARVAVRPADWRKMAGTGR